MTLREPDLLDRDQANQMGAGTGRQRLLDGLLVVDLSRVLAGPYAAMMLGDLGARVVKVERPDGGDDTRGWGPPFAGPEEERQSTYFLAMNRNKESLVLDFKDSGDRALLDALVARADVLIENFRPGVMDRLGLAHDRLLERNPRLVVLSISGFGHDGPDAGRTGFDQIVQGEAGLMSLTGPDDAHPTKIGVPVSDLVAGMTGAFGVMAALHARERTGRGEVVRTSLLAASVATHVFQATRWLVGGEVPRATGNAHPTVAPYGAFACRDGTIQIAVANDAIWRRFAPLVGLDPADPLFATNERRVANYEELARAISAALSAESCHVWLSRFDAGGIPAGEIKSLDQVYDSEQTRSQGLLLEVEHAALGPIRLPGPPLRFGASASDGHLPPPVLGEHTERIRAWLAGAEPAV